MMEEGKAQQRARWQRMEEIYHAALPLTAAERHAFVAQRCDGDEALKKEVISLLVADDVVADFLREPVAELGMTLLADENLYDTEIISQSTQTPFTDLVGTKVGGRYEVIKRLGGGGFGDVYKAADAKVMSRPVIIKVLKDEVLREESAKRDWVLTKFRQEIEALAKLDHSGVVRILDADTLPGGRPYIVMEFVEGSDLRRYIKDARQQQLAEQGLGFKDVAEIVRQVGRTLTAAHEAEIFHRDLKPENIMLRHSMSGDLQVKVIDFGIAKVRNSLIAPSTASGLFNAGTWQYMSPMSLWGTGTLRGDLENGAGQLVTQREIKSSGAMGVQKRTTDDDEDDLKQDDPPPQMIFRKVVNPGGKMLFIVRLPYKDAAPSSQIPQK